MRVISGHAKGRRLQRVPGDTTRPIMDRVKESLFNILGIWVRDGRWLDLFAGTGQVGIEALSRGAAEVVFIDLVRPAIKTIQHNLRITRLQEKGTVLQQDAFVYLKDRVRQPFDLIYIAPPQYKRLWVEALQIVDQDPDRYLLEDGLAVVQIDPKELEEVPLQNLYLQDERRYGNTVICFFAKREEV